MRRFLNVCSGYPLIVRNGQQQKQPQQKRFLWCMEHCFANATNATDFLRDVREGCQKDKDWRLDFSKLYEKGSRVGLHTVEEKKMLVGQIGAAVANCGVAPSSLELILPSTDEVRLAEMCFDTNGFLSNLQKLSICIHSSAFSKGENRGRAGAMEEDVQCSQEMEQIAEMFVALSEHVSQTLHTFELTAVDTSMDSEASWDDLAVSAIATFLENVKLSSLTLNYVNCQQCTKATLLALAHSFLASKQTLRVLDLKGMRAFIHYSSFFDTGVLNELNALQKFDISYTLIGDLVFRNVLRCLYKAIGGWYHLKALGVAQCELGEYAVELLTREIREVEDDDEILLEELNFSSNKLQDDTVFLLSSCLVLCKKLKVLDLRHNNLTKRSIAQVASSLSNADGLEVLRLRSNRISDEGLAEMMKYAKHWPALVELDLTRCRLTSRSLAALHQSLPFFPDLKVLRLAGNDLRAVDYIPQTMSAEEIKLFAFDPAFMKSRGNAKVPTSFELDRLDREKGRKRYKGPNMDDEAEKMKNTTDKLDLFAYFGESLSSCRNLEILDLSDTSLQDKSVAELFQTTTLPQLKELRLSSNPLFAGSPESVDQLEAMLWSCSNVEVLDLAFTGLGDFGLSVLCDGNEEGKEGVLLSLKSLRELHLSHCHIEKTGLEVLITHLPRLVSLKRLQYDGNRCNGEELELLLKQAADHSDVLEFLGLSGCTPLRESLARTQSYQRLREKGVIILV